MTDTGVLIHQLQGSLNGKTLRGGTTTVTWPGGSPVADTQTVDHGLGDTPGSIQLTPVASRNVEWDVENVTTTSFDVVVETRDASSPVAGTERFFYWMAIG